MDRYAQVLQELIRNTGLEGALLVSADGLPIASVLKPGMEEDRIAAMSAAILSLGERVSEELAKGTLEQITVKGHDGYVILTGVGKEAVMVVLADNNAKLGLLLMEIRKSQDKLKGMF
ncbi:MAG: roadblock/LC7 domain-containing protein [Aquificaceae bacterium]|nr:roadblock/LC7 domain-containing protein [Aquificaceae bacterium]MDW8097575.1 roadblock/LC7 domain-containing protein [Aquificaceae bacterium]